MFEEPELHLIKFPDLGEEWRSERERKRSEGRRRYRDHLLELLAILQVSSIDLPRWADAILDHLFVINRREGDGDCVCSCHPRLPEGDLHDYGFACSCQLTADERRTGFLLADNGESARRSRPYTFNQYFASDAGDLQSQPGSPRGAQRVDPRVP